MDIFSVYDSGQGLIIFHIFLDHHEAHENLNLTGTTFSKKRFQTIKHQTNALKVQIYYFSRPIVTYYNRWHQ